MFMWPHNAGVWWGRTTDSREASERFPSCALKAA